MGNDSQLSSISIVGFKRQCRGGWGHRHGVKRTAALLAAFTSAQIDTLRDIRLFRLDKKRILVISCDSAGGIGPKPIDRIRVSGYVVGKFTARVALMEALWGGGLPFCVVVTLSVKPEPTGIQVLRGVRSELNYASASYNVAEHREEFPGQTDRSGSNDLELCVSKIVADQEERERSERVIFRKQVIVIATKTSQNETIENVP
jgi:hypothetical protein